MQGATQLNDIWDFTLLWDTIAYILKLVSPFTLIVVAILSVGAIMLIVVYVARAAGGRG